MRVVVAQFAVGVDVRANLATCLGALDDAARLRPDLIVFPEFCNHPSWYDDKAHCHAVSLDLDGEFLGAIAARAQAIQAIWPSTARCGGGRADAPTPACCMGRTASCWAPATSRC